MSFPYLCLPDMGINPFQSMSALTGLLKTHMDFPFLSLFNMHLYSKWLKKKTKDKNQTNKQKNTLQM